jgi:hypothetical protein
MKDRDCSDMKSFASELQTRIEEIARKETRGKGKGASGTKRAPSGYNLFGSDYRKKHGNDEDFSSLAPTKKMSAIGAAWKELDDAEKEKWNKKAKSKKKSSPKKSSGKKKSSPKSSGKKKSGKKSSGKKKST